ncbi:hypothetical protein OROMI_002379 [Orobanche minor]
MRYQRSSNTAISIDILRKLKHENILSMLDSFESLQEFCVVTEFTQGEIFEILRDDTCLPEEQVQAIAKQLCESIALSPLKLYNSSGHETRKHTRCAGSVVKVYHKLCDFGFAAAMSANSCLAVNKRFENVRFRESTPVYETKVQKTYFPKSLEKIKMDDCAYMVT